MVKVFTLNSRGMIELTKEEVEALLQEAYNEGYNKGSGTYTTAPITWPPGVRGIDQTWYYTNTTTASNTTDSNTAVVNTSCNNNEVTYEI